MTTDEVLWSVAYEEEGAASKNIYKTGGVLADAAAQMYVYLAGNGLLPSV